jgi:hypothetical protein
MFLSWILVPQYLVKQLCLYWKYNEIFKLCDDKFWTYGDYVMLKNYLKVNAFLNLYKTFVHKLQ